MPVITLGREDCDSLDRLQHWEWLETDGLGNHAAGTVSGVHTRREHGWLVAAGSGERCVLLAKCEESLFVGGQRYDLGANQYPDTIHPQGYRHLIEFRLDPWPVWVYEVDDAVIERHLTMLHDAAVTVVTYQVIRSEAIVAIELRPLVAGRPVEQVAGEDTAFSRDMQSCGEELWMEPYGPDSRLVLTYPGGAFLGDGFWFYRFQYARDHERGLSGSEDLFNPGVIFYTLHEGERALVAAGTTSLDGLDLDAALVAEAERRGRVAAPHALARAADSYLIRHRGQSMPRAGYPWPDEEASPSLTTAVALAITTGHGDDAQELLAVAASRLAHRSRPLAGLDLAWAAERYVTGGDAELLFARVLRPALAAWIRHCRAGGQENVHVGADGLLEVLEPTELGPLGINALWHRVLRLCGERADLDVSGLVGVASPADRLLAAAEPGLLDDAQALALLASLPGEAWGPWGLWRGGVMQPAWLGLFGEALARLGPRGPATFEALVAPLEAALRANLLGHLAQAYDAQGNAVGLPASAVSVAEALWLLRLAEGAAGS